MARALDARLAELERRAVALLAAGSSLAPWLANVPTDQLRALDAIVRRLASEGLELVVRRKLPTLTPEDVAAMSARERADCYRRLIRGSCRYE
jgi:hypothetical protein